MPELEVGALIAAYVAVALLLLSLHLYSNWGLLTKAAITVVVTGFFFVTYVSYPQLMGWPLVTDRLPSRLHLLGIQTVEPDSIYLWARDLDQGFGDKRPRAYELSYSKSLHQSAAKAGRKLRRNIAVMVEIDPLPDGPKAKISESAGTVVGNSIVRFSEVPEGLSPPKE